MCNFRLGWFGFSRATGSSGLDLLGRDAWSGCGVADKPCKCHLCFFFLSSSVCFEFNIYKNNCKGFAVLEINQVVQRVVRPHLKRFIPVPNVSPGCFILPPWHEMPTNPVQIKCADGMTVHCVDSLSPTIMTSFSNTQKNELVRNKEKL